MTASSLIDLDHLELYVAGDDALRDEILGIFEEQTQIWASMLDPSSEDAVWRNAAHALKGAARGVGAWRLGDLCAEAEEMTGPANNLDSRTKILSDLQQTGRETIAEIRRLRDASSA